MARPHRQRGTGFVKTLLTLALLGGLGAGGWYTYQRYNAKSDVPAFLTKALERGNITRTVAATGTIEPIVKTIVGSEVSGNITQWHVDFNQPVKAGEVLAEINPDLFQTARDRAAAQLAIAEASARELEVRYNDAAREEKRIEGLHRINNASENEMLVAQMEAAASKAAWDAAKAQIEAARATFNEAEADLNRTLVRSPIDGVVIARNVENGQTVAAAMQAPELYVIAADLKKMQVNANVSEADIGQLREGGPATFRVDAYPSRTFDGQISQIRYNATDVDGIVTYTTLIQVNNDDLALRPGMTANVTFETARAQDVVRIPNAALRFDPNPPAMGGFRRPPQKGPGYRKPKVFMLVNGKPVAREVEIGMSDGSFTELKGGEVEEGDAVIIERNFFGKSGSRRDVTRSLRRS